MTTPSGEVRDEIVKEINQAAQALQKAWQLAVTAHPVAAEVPVIQRVKGIATECNELMRQVSKLRI